MMQKRLSSFSAFALALALVACDKAPAETTGTAASALQPIAAPAPNAQQFEVQSTGSKVTFVMDSPLEKIHGEAPGSVQGTLSVNLEDLSKSTGLVKIDLLRLSLYQQKRAEEGVAFGERVKSDLQNEHAQNWLQIHKDAPEDVRQKNRFVEFKVDKLEAAQSNVNQLKGAERKINVTVAGEFLLHGRKVNKKAELSMTFRYEGNQPQSVTVKTRKPVVVELNEHDVRPREAWDKVVAATMKTVTEVFQKIGIDKKVAEEVPIEFEFKATAK